MDKHVVQAQTLADKHGSTYAVAEVRRMFSDDTYYVIGSVREILALESYIVRHRVIFPHREEANLKNW